jgi:hypothetical protein
MQGVKTRCSACWLDAAACVHPQRKGSSTMVIKLAQAKFPDALGMEMKEIKIASARAAAGHHVLLLPKIAGIEFIIASEFKR